MTDFEDTLRHSLHERADGHLPAPDLAERVEARIAVHDRRRKARRLRPRSRLRPAHRRRCSRSGRHPKRHACVSHTPVGGQRLVADG